MPKALLKLGNLRLILSMMNEKVLNGCFAHTKSSHPFYLLFSLHCCVLCRCCSSLLMYLYRSFGLWAGDVAMGDCDEGPKFGMVLANVTDDALRRFKIGDFWRLISC